MRSEDRGLRIQDSGLRIENRGLRTEDWKCLAARLMENTISFPPVQFSSKYFNIYSFDQLKMQFINLITNLFIS